MMSTVGFIGLGTMGRPMAANLVCSLPGLVEGSAADNSYTAKFAAALLAKDLGLATTAADSAGVELVVGRGARNQLDELSVKDGHLDASAVIKMVGLE
jgi:3-hydroxyisobutyrate dehydrogenase